MSLDIPIQILNTKSTSSGKVKSKSYKSLNARITRKAQRKFVVSRVGKILDILPQFSKFYNSLKNDEIMAIKYYKGPGSLFQTSLLTMEDKKKELTFPFNIWDEKSLRSDVYGGNTESLLPFNTSLDIKDIPKYIENSYGARIMGISVNNLAVITSEPKRPYLKGYPRHLTACNWRLVDFLKVEILSSISCIFSRLFSI